MRETRPIPPARGGPRTRGVDAASTQRTGQAVHTRQSPSTRDGESPRIRPNDRARRASVPVPCAWSVTGEFPCAWPRSERRAPATRITPLGRLDPSPSPYVAPRRPPAATRAGRRSVFRARPEPPAGGDFEPNLPTRDFSSSHPTVRGVHQGRRFATPFGRATLPQIDRQSTCLICRRRIDYDIFCIDFVMSPTSNGNCVS